MTKPKRPADYDDSDNILTEQAREVLQGKALPAENPPSVSLNPLADPAQEFAEFLPMMAGFEISEEEKIAFLAVLADLIQRFVELGFGDDSVSMIQAILIENAGSEADDQVK